MLSGVPGVRAAIGGIEDVEGSFNRISLVLPLLHPWAGRGDKPVHTHAATADLLGRTLDALPRLLAPGGRAVLYAQNWTPDLPADTRLAAAFGDRRWAYRFAVDHEGETAVGPLQAGIFEIEAA
jgi:hypothetical protein